MDRAVMTSGLHTNATMQPYQISLLESDVPFSRFTHRVSCCTISTRFNFFEKTNRYLRFVVVPHLCIYLFTLIGECTPSILFLRLSVLVRHSSSLDAILQSSNARRPCVMFPTMGTFRACSAQSKTSVEYCGRCPNNPSKSPAGRHKAGPSPKS